MSVTRSEMNEVNETLAKHEALIESLGKKIEENDKKAYCGCNLVPRILASALW